MVARIALFVMLWYVYCSVPIKSQLPKNPLNCDDLALQLKSCNKAEALFLNQAVALDVLESPHQIYEICDSTSEGLSCVEQVLGTEELQRVATTCPKLVNNIEAYVNHKFFCTPEGMDVFIKIAKNIGTGCTVGINPLRQVCYDGHLARIQKQHKLDLKKLRSLATKMRGGRKVPFFLDSGSELIFLATTGSVASQPQCELLKMSEACDLEAMEKMCGAEAVQYHKNLYRARRVIVKNKDCFQTD